MDEFDGEKSLDIEELNRVFSSVAERVKEKYEFPFVSRVIEKDCRERIRSRSCILFMRFYENFLNVTRLAYKSDSIGDSSCNIIPLEAIRVWLK